MNLDGNGIDQAKARHRSGDLGGAALLYRRILRDHPGDGDANHCLGILLRQTGRIAEAVDHLRQAVAALPDDATVRRNFAIVLQDSGRAREAEGEFARLIALQPDSADAHLGLGLAIAGQGRAADAIPHLRRAAELAPANAEAWCNLGIACRAAGRRDDAVAAFIRATDLAPDLAKAHGNLGSTLFEANRLEEAVTAWRRALDLDPDHPDVHADLGIALGLLGRGGEAIESFRRAVALEDGDAVFHFNLGLALHGAGRFADALASHRRAIELAPGHAPATLNMGVALKELGRLDEAVACFRKALDLQPDFPEALAHLVHQRHHVCDWDGLAAEEERLLDLVRQGRGGIAPFPLLSLPSTPADQLACARAYGNRYRAPPATVFSHGPGGSVGRIRIGYLSADFHAHATAYLVAELMERHGRDRFEVAGYSCGVDDGSAMRRRLTAAFDRFVDLRPLSDWEAARRIHADGIDILVDLKGFTREARTRILGFRPAAIQVNFLGYPGTMGAEFIDYVIADPVCIPPGHEAFFGEKVVRLPDCYQPNDAKREIAEPTPSRAECGLPERGFVFCSFNNPYKITPAFFAAWMRLLEAVPGSVLWLLAANDRVEANLRREAAARGVAPERLVFAPRRPLPDHLARHRLADLFLDTLPYNAHTTASDALWAGLPVVTCAGSTFAGRVAASLLTAIGLPDLITATLPDYQAMALRLATDPAALASVAARLRDNRASAPLFDGGRYTRNLEAAYGRMWDLHRAGRPPESFDVAAIELASR
jgi:predicted O-linked N-acetylglucosamine transferase (SPINDLY family)